MGSLGRQFVYVSTSFVAIHINVPSVAESVASSQILGECKLSEKFANSDVKMSILSSHRNKATLFIKRWVYSAHNQGKNESCGIKMC